MIIRAADQAKIEIEQRFKEEVRAAPLEAAAARARRKQRLAELGSSTALEIGQGMEQGRQDLLAVRGQREQTRATGAGVAIDYQQAKVKALSADLEAAKKIQAENEEFLKRIGVPAWMLPGVDPRAKQLIEEQKNTLIMGIDETLQKNLASINQFKASEEEKARLIRTVTQTANVERQVVNDQAIRQINEMYDAAAKLRDELWKAGEAVSLGLSANLDEALAKIRSGMLQIGVMGGSGLKGVARTGGGLEPGSGPAAAPPWSRAVGGGGGEGPVYVGPPGQTPIYETPPSFQFGGFVPMRPWGPQNAIGREIPVMAAPGELILNQREQAVVRHLVGQGGDGAGLQINAPITITVNGSQEDPTVLARRIGREVSREIERLVAMGWCNLRAP